MFVVVVVSQSRRGSPLFFRMCESKRMRCTPTDKETIESLCPRSLHTPKHAQVSICGRSIPLQIPFFPTFIHQRPSCKRRLICQRAFWHPRLDHAPKWFFILLTETRVRVLVHRLLVFEQIGCYCGCSWLCVFVFGIDCCQKSRLFCFLD